MLTWLRRRWPWLLGIVAGGIVSLIIAGVVVVRSPWFEAWLADLIVAELERATFEDASLDRAKVTFFGPGVELQGLTLSDQDTGEALVQVASIRAPLALDPFAPSPRLGTVRVRDPVVRLALDERGRLTAFQRPDDAPPGRPLRELPLEGLHLTGGDVELLVPDGRVTLKRLAVQPGADGHRLTGRLDGLWRQFSDGAELDVSGIHLGRTAIDIDDLAVDLHTVSLSGPVHLPLQGALDARIHVDSDLRELSPLLSGPRFFLGEATSDVHVHGRPAALVADLSLTADGFAYDAPGKVWPRIRYGVDHVTARATATADGVVVHELLVDESGGRVTATGRLGPVVQADGTSRWELLESEVTGESLSLAALLRAFSAAPDPWVDFDGRVTASLAGPLQPLELTGPVHVDLADFTVRQGPVDVDTSTRMLDIPAASIDGALTIFKDHLVLDAEQLDTGNNQGSVVADIGFGPQGPLDLSFDLARADLRVLRPLGGSELTGRGRLRGRLWGDFSDLQVRGRGHLAGFSVSGIPYADELDARIASPDMKRLVLTEARGRVGETTYTGSFEMDFAARGLPMDTAVDVESGRIEDLIGMFVDLGEVATGELVEGELWLRGPLNHLDGAADLTLGRTTLAGETFERGRARGRMTGGTFELDGITVERGATDQLELTGTVGRAWALDLEGTGTLDLAALDQLEGWDVVGAASVDLRVDNTLFDPAPHGRIDLRQVAVSGRPLPDSEIRAETVDGVLTAHGNLIGDSVNADFSLGLWDDQPYTLTATMQDLPLDRMWPEGADGEPITATASGDVELWGTFGETWTGPEIRVRVPEVSVAWRDHRLKSNPARPWRVVLDAQGWRVHDIGLSGGDTTLTVSGRGDEVGTLVTGEGLVDAALLPAVVPGLTRAEGFVDVQVTAGGPSGSADTVVDLHLDAPILRHESLPAALEDVQARASLTPEAFLITHFASSVGGGRITGDVARSPRLGPRFEAAEGMFPVGIIEADGWVPQRFDLFARATDVQMQWIDDLPPAVGDATIAFDGPADALLLHADVTVREMAFTQRIDWEDWVVALEDDLLVEAPPSDEEPWFGLDIHIQADRSIRLLNNVSDATVSADLNLMGDTSRMGLLGDVSVEEGVVYVQDRAFEVERGELRWDDPFTWDPLLDFDLRADVQSRARQFRVNYRITGPYSSWTSTTESEPRLPQADINALLWFGVTADDLEDMGELTNAVGLAAADFVVKDFVQNDYLGLGLGDNQLLERLPELDLNTGVNLRGEYSSEPRLLIKQRWSPTLSTQAEINLVRDDHFVRFDWRTEEAVVLSAWYASRRREGFTLPINGALGVDLRWVIEVE